MNWEKCSGQKSTSGLMKNMEKDYDAQTPQEAKEDISQKIMREIIIPILDKEVNEGRHFATLRQVYHSVLLAVWFKGKLRTAIPSQSFNEKSGMVKGNILSLIYVDQHKTGGLEMLMASFSLLKLNYHQEQKTLPKEARCLNRILHPRLPRIN